MTERSHHIAGATDSIFMVACFTPNSVPQYRALLDVARTVGVKHVVKLSVISQS